MVHNQLPLGSRRILPSRVHDEVLSLCPCCLKTVESMDHFLRCPSNPSSAAGVRKLGSILAVAPNHPTVRILVAEVKHWLGNSAEPFAPNLHGYPAHMTMHIELALKSQARIGWYQALKGFFSREWRDLAAMDLYDSSHHDVNLGANRMNQVIKAIWEYTSSTWKSRNEVLHSQTLAEMAAIRSTELAEIRQVFQNPGILSFADRHLCDRSLDTLVRGSASTRRRWLRRVKMSCARLNATGLVNR